MNPKYYKEDNKNPLMFLNYIRIYELRIFIKVLTLKVYTDSFFGVNEIYLKISTQQQKLLIIEEF